MDKEKNYSNLHRGLVLKYFWQIVRNFKLSFFAMMFFSIITLSLDIYIPFQFLRLWDILSTNDFSLVYEAQSIVIIILILGFVRWLLKRIFVISADYFVSNVMAGLRRQAFSYMIKHSHSFFANNFGGSLTQKINKYARSFQYLIDRFIENGFPLLVRSIGSIIAIYILLPKYAYMFLIFILIFVITALIYTRFKLKYDIAAALADTKTVGALADSIGNHSSIQLFTGHKHEDERVGEVIQDQKKKTLFNWYLWDLLGSVQSFYILIFEFLIFWFAIGDWRLGLITVPVIILIQGYLIRLLDSLWGFSGLVRAFYEGFADAEEMAVILNTPYEIEDSNTGIKLENVKGEIVFENVSYVYENNNTNVLENFSINIPNGQKIALVGFSGAGKSTFVKLLMRLFNLNNGKILIDGVNISEVSQENLRENIGFVPQDPVLFHRTLMENIRYGRRDATDEEVKRAATLAHCDEFIVNLPKGYDTYVGERGVKLSGGERQRVAIARAILKNAPILVLDEATSSLDSHSEALIQDALKKLMAGKTTIVIAHRLSTIREMDRIVVLDKGKIIEDGTHNELTSKENGIYKKLWDIQALGFSFD